MRTRHWLVTVAVCLAALAQAPAALAGPKQTIKITFPKNPTLALTEGTLLECLQPGCATSKPFYREGSGFSCGGTQCTGEAYIFPTQLKFTIARKDGISLTSSMFEKKSFDANYTATLTGDTLEVTEQ